MLRWHREAPDLGTDTWILGRQRIRVAELDIRRLDAEPFCRGAEKPAPPANHARGVECVARDKEVDPMALAQIRADDVPISTLLPSSAPDNPDEEMLNVPYLPFEFFVLCPFPTA